MKGPARNGHFSSHLRDVIFATYEEEPFLETSRAEWVCIARRFSLSGECLIAESPVETNGTRNVHWPDSNT